MGGHGVRTLLVVPAIGVPRTVVTNVTLEALKALVGGWIEHVSLSPEGDALYCNEEGKILGLPANPAASALAHALGWSAGDVLMGDVVFSSDGPNGTDGSVRDYVLDLAALDPDSEDD